MSFKEKISFILVKNRFAFSPQKFSKTRTLELKPKRFSFWDSFDFVCYFISYLMVKSDLEKNFPFKSYRKNSESLSLKFLLKISIFVLQRYVWYEYWPIFYEVFLMCYVSRSIKLFLKFFFDILGTLFGYQNLKVVLLRI